MIENLLEKFLCTGNLASRYRIIGYIPAIIRVPPIVTTDPRQRIPKRRDQIKHGPRYDNIVVSTKPKRYDYSSNTSA